MIYRYAMLQCQLFHGTGLQQLAASGGAVWLGISRNNLMSGTDQRLQMAGGKIRRTGKNNT